MSMPGRGRARPVRRTRRSVVSSKRCASCVGPTRWRNQPVGAPVLRRSEPFAHRSVKAGILTNEQKQLAFRLRGRGWRLVDIAREIGCTAPLVGLMVRDGRFTTGVPDDWNPGPGCLGIADREEILVGIHAGESLSSIARRLDRSPSTVTREV